MGGTTGMASGAGGAGGQGFFGGMAQNWQQSGGLNGLMSNPWFQMGNSIMSQNGQSQNPMADGIMGGWQNAQQIQEHLRQQAALAALRKQWEEQSRSRLPDKAQRQGGQSRPAGEMPGKSLGGTPSTSIGGTPTTTPSPFMQLLGAYAQADPLGATRFMLEQRQGNRPTSKMQDFEFYNSLSPGEQQIWSTLNARQQNNPAILQEMVWLNDPARTDEEIDQYWNAKRAGTMFQVGSQPKYRPPGPNRTPVPLASVQDVATNEQVVNAAKAVGTAQGGAQSQLPAMELEVEETLGFIEELRNHPGRSMGTGKSSMLNWAATPGSDVGDFLSKLDTAKGKAFAIAYETLKGGGTITEVETEMATKALANLDASQSDQQFLKALGDFERAVLRGYNKLKAAAGQGSYNYSAPSIDDDYETRLKAALGE